MMVESFQSPGGKKRELSEGPLSSVGRRICVMGKETQEWTATRGISPLMAQMVKILPSEMQAD